MEFEQLLSHMEEDTAGDDAELGASSKKKRRLQSEGGEVNRKKTRSERKVAPPTADEMIHLRETETLFKSNLLRLEIEEMLRETTPLKGLEKASSEWISSFSNLLAKMDEDEDWNHVSDTDWLNNIGVKFPLPDLGLMYDGAYKFVRPFRVEAIGSYACNCSLGPKFNLDVAVILPKGFYRKKDYLNQTYHYKRALYLCAIAGELTKSNLIATGSTLKFIHIAGDSLKPALVVDPGGKGAGKLSVFIHVLPDPQTFPLSRFLPSSNNVRTWWWNDSRPPEEPGELRPTPLYNNSIAEDLVTLSNEQLRKKALEENPNMRDAVRLLRVWITQRNLNQGHRGFSPYLVSMVLIYLREKQKVNKHMSSYQLIRILWLYLSESDWCKEGATMHREDPTVEAPPLTLFHNSYEVVFLDPSGYVNLAARLDKSTYLKVKSESALALELLDKSEHQAFHSLFMVQMPFMHQYDHFISFKNEDAIREAVMSELSQESDVDHNGDPTARFLNLLREKLNLGLGNRLLELGFELVAPKSWSIDSLPPVCLYDSVTIGLRLHPQHALRLVDRGPQPNLAEGAEFRALWGEKCEVRRFKDGTVCECVIWDKGDEGKEGDAQISRRLSVNERICRFLLSKIGLESNDYSYISNQLEHVINIKQNGLSAEDAAVRVQRSLAELSRQLVELKDLPLEVNTVHCISPVYRYSEVFPPVPAKPKFSKKRLDPSWIETPDACKLADPLTSAPPYIRPIDLVVQMTFTRKWPNDLMACRRLTAAFYIAIAKKLEEKHKLRFILQSDCLLIQKHGFMWRLWLSCSKEISLLKMEISNSGVERYRDTAVSIELENKFVNLPNLSGALHGLSVGEPGFGGTARLVKRWLSSQLIDSSEMPGIVSELIVASIVMSPQPFCPLLQPQQLFIRYLYIMATTDWTSRLLIVNFNNLLSKEDMREAQRRFDRDRKSLPALAIVTPYDLSGSMWTRLAPTLPTLVRLARLASAALDILRQQLLSFSTPTDFTSVFVPNLEIYDLVINLKASMIPRRSEKVGQREEKFKNIPDICLPVTDFDPPLMYLDYLRQNYKEFALFMYDEYGGRQVGVLFRPSILQPVPQLKVNTANCTYPDYTSDPPCLKINLKSLISDFKEVGKGLVESTTVSSRIQKLIVS